MHLCIAFDQIKHHELISGNVQLATIAVGPLRYELHIYTGMLNFLKIIKEKVVLGDVILNVS